MRDDSDPPSDKRPRFAFGVPFRLEMSDSSSADRVGMERGELGVGPTTTVARLPRGPVGGGVAGLMME